MPAFDRTFSGRDVIRLYSNHLEPVERREVDDFFRSFLELRPPEDGEDGPAREITDPDQFSQDFLEILFNRLERLSPFFSGFLFVLSFFVHLVSWDQIIDEALGTPQDTEA